MRLDEIADIYNGGTPDTETSAYWGGSIPWCTPTDITAAPNKYIAATARNITEHGLMNSAAILLPTGSLLMCTRATIGHIRISRVPMCTNQGFKSLVPKQGVSNEFLFYLLMTQTSRLTERASGSTFLEIGKREVAALTVMLPPLDEQRAIAKILSDVDRLLDSLEALLAKKRAVQNATMQQLLTGKIRLPGFSGQWESKRIGGIGRMLPTANNTRSELDEGGSVEYIHYGDIHALARSVLDCSRASLPRIEANRVASAAHLRDGDLVMVDASEDLVGVGKGVEVQQIGNRTVVAGLHTILYRGIEEHWAMGFKAYLQFIPMFRWALQRIATGISVYGISKKQVAEIELSLPPRPEQDAIVSVLSSMDTEIEALEQRRDKTRALKQGMMQQLLTGQTRLVEPRATEKHAAGAPSPTRAQGRHNA